MNRVLSKSSVAVWIERTATNATLRHHRRQHKLLSTSPSSSSRSVWSFGDNSHGALGLPTPPYEAREPTRIVDLPTDVSAVSAGHYHSLAVTASGHVWAWGRNSEAQLGRGPSPSRQSWYRPQMVEGLSDVNVRAAFASGVVSAAVGYDGSLWTWGKSKRGQLGLGKGIVEALKPSRVEALSRHHIVKVAFGWGHALAQTREGELFGWGYSADGMLGQLGAAFEQISPPLPVGAGRTNSDVEPLVAEVIEKERNMPITWEPTILQELSDVKVADLACGLDHTLVLCSDGTLLSSGNNEYGQLGRSTIGSQLLPVEMSFRPLSVYAGLGHSMAICQDLQDDVKHTRLVTWGWNWASQLGREGPENNPKIVEGLNEDSLVSASGGRVHTIALTSSGQIWTWGSGMNGRLGLGSSANETEPTLVECLEGINVQQAVSGFDHNLLLVAE